MRKLPETKSCILELDNGWLTIWFNRPEKRNALSDTLLNDIKDTVKSVHNDRSIRGIIFRGKGGNFCSGADLDGIKKIASSGKNARNLAINMSMTAGSTFEVINKSPQITISVVEGSSIAGAFGIACATDLLITMSDARYALTETKIGLTPAQIAPYVLNRLGFAQAKRLMLFGSLFDGNEAFKMGMADHIAYDEGQLKELIDKVKSDVRKCAPNAISITKRIIASNHSVDSQKAAELFADCVTHKEGREGFASFFEKRKPYWS